MITPDNLTVGTIVRKTSGYPYPGVIVARFSTTAGKTRYVVEATGSDYRGMLHIFSPEQLQKTECAKIRAELGLTPNAPDICTTCNLPANPGAMTCCSNAIHLGTDATATDQGADK